MPALHATGPAFCESTFGEDALLRAVALGNLFVWTTVLTRCSDVGAEGLTANAMALALCAN